MIPAFAHHLIPLLSQPGAAGALGGKVHLAAIKEACKSAERIHGALAMAGRFEVAVVSDDIDFFDPAPGLARARNLAWETIRMTPRLLWVILTRHPEFISVSLPSTWIAKGFQNVCIGLVVDGADEFPEKLRFLRKAPVQRRMIHLSPCNPPIDLSGQLGEIDWVVSTGNSEDSSQARAIEASCREANVAFLFYQPDSDMETNSLNSSSDDAQLWPVHPFGTKIQLFQPTLPQLKPISIVMAEPSSSSTLIENSPGASHPVTMKINESPGPSTTTTPTPTPEPLTEIVKFEVVTPEPIAKEPAPGPPVISDNTYEEFTQFDGVVRRGLATFIEVGDALAKIRDRELWRAGRHSSWAAYCQAVGGLTKIHANRLIKGSEVVSNIAEVKPTGFTYPDVTPRSEWQIRPLHRLPDAEQQGIAWYRAVELANGQPTEKLISDIVAELMADDSPPVSKPNHKQRVAEVFGRLRASVSAKNSVTQIEGLITELEKLLRIA